MGTHQRDWAEEVEISVADAINGKSVDLHVWQVANSITNRISSLYQSPIDHAVWTGGNSYQNAGDVEVVLKDNSVVPVEIKISFIKGSGTKANPSTSVLKKHINENIKTYPQFDEELGLKTQRYALVEQRIGRPLKNASDYAKNLRNIRDTGNADFLDVIADITSPGQEQYAMYAAEQMNNYLNNVNQWVKKILAGNNTTQSVPVVDNLLYCVVKNFESKNQTVEFYDFTDMDSNITNVVSSGKSIKLQNKSGKDVLRLSVTWKNICQGGQTPCFNVFVGNAFTS
jgi:hypothetical protein